MTIGTQAYLQGYMHEKTAGKSGWVQSSENEQSDKFHRGGFPGGFQQYAEQAGTHPMRRNLDEINALAAKGIKGRLGGIGRAAKSVSKGVFNILQPTDHDLWEKKQMEQRYGDPVKRGNTIMPKYRKTILEGQAEAARLRNEGK